jgi:hypothetical protein
MTLEQVRAVADAVLYEGYLLYPYRASSSKNRSRWQFGVLGPPHASADSFGEPPAMAMQGLLERTGDEGGQGPAAVTVHLRFLQLQARSVDRLADDGYVPVEELVVDGRSVLSWQEATECEVELPPYAVDEVFRGRAPRPLEHPVHVPGGEEVEALVDRSGTPVGRLVRRRARLAATVTVAAERDDGYARVSVTVRNTCPEEVAGKDAATAVSLIGAHLLVVAEGGRFVSLLEPPVGAADAAARCRQDRCYPVLAGPSGARDVVLGSPIILYDYPEIAAESAGALFDSTEIDEILTLRVMTMTEAEKDEARATDPRAAEIIDRCDALSPDALQQLHGVLRDPHAGPRGDPAQYPTGETPADPNGTDVPWWDPAADDSVAPGTDAVLIDGVRVRKGSRVRVHPSRRADAQDLFFAGQEARVTAVLSDVDGGTHVALVLEEDPAADLHEWYGRYFYFAPDELEPLDVTREESRP